MQKFNHGIAARNARRDVIYYPVKRPGFVAWVTGFDYGNGDIGISFKETLQIENKNYVPPRLEMGEAVGAPVSYCSVECGSAKEESYRVYLRSADNGRTFTETGRCQLEQGSFCNVGFPDGRIMGFDIPRINARGTSWCDYIDVRESADGGATWHSITKLLEGTAPYLWRARRLKDGTVILLASLYGTPWGEGKMRATRNTMLPGESYLRKIQTFFLTTKDGRNFSGPHYVLPGIGAHEYDVAECADGSLLFIAGDVQATPVARQTVVRQGDAYINGTLYPIQRGAPQNPDKDPQGGFVPETLVMLSDTLLVGARRNKPYACSNDFGENWYEMDGLPQSLYQPYMMLLPNGEIANFGHFGGDAAFGQEDMYVGADFFKVENQLPSACTLTLTRCLSADKSHFENRFSATLQHGSAVVAGETVTFRFAPVWNADNTVNTAPQCAAALQKEVVTNEKGTATIAVPEFDAIADIHFYYNVDVVYAPTQTGRYRACNGPLMCVAALTPYRENSYPYDAYFAEGTLFLSPQLLKNNPDAQAQLTACCGEKTLTKRLPPQLQETLQKAHVLIYKDNVYHWYTSVHSKNALDKVLVMAGGDWYV